MTTQSLSALTLQVVDHEADLKPKTESSDSTFTSTRTGRYIRWLYPAQSIDSDVTTIIERVVRQTKVIEKEAQAGCCAPTKRCCTSTLGTILKVITLGGFFGLIPLLKLYCCNRACAKSEDNQVLDVVADISWIPPWNFTAHKCLTKWTLTSCCFKGISPWTAPPYSEAECVFTEARKRLFSELDDPDKKNVQVTIQAPGDVELNGIWIKGEGKKAILYVPGIGGLYEEAAVQWIIRDFITFLQQTFKGVDILIVNPRGTGISQSSSTLDTFQVDVLCSFKFLVAQGFDPEKTVIWGHSLGGGRGMLGAALVQKEYPDKKISMVSDRSFLNVSDVAKARFLCCGGVVGKYVQENGLEMDCQLAANSLKGQIVAIASEEDDTIPYAQSSFVIKFPSQEGRNYIRITLEKSAADAKGKSSPHTRKFTAKEGQQVQVALEQIFGKNGLQTDDDKKSRGDQKV